MFNNNIDEVPYIGKWTKVLLGKYSVPAFIGVIIDITPEYVKILGADCLQNPFLNDLHFKHLYVKSVRIPYWYENNVSLKYARCYKDVWLNIIESSMYRFFLSNYHLVTTNFNNEYVLSNNLKREVV